MSDRSFLPENVEMSTMTFGKFQQGIPSWQSREQGLLASYAMFSRLSVGREHPEPVHPYRGPYQRDRDRVLHSSAFRRLSGKMQVFTGDMGIYHRTRLTHTQEVASIARTIGRVLRLNEDLIEALALLHDIGHPPFGHCGEDALNICLKNFGGFSHNRFALELVHRIEQRYTPYPGLNLTQEVLAGQEHRSDKGSPTTPLLEVQIVDAADSLAYDAHDLDDALKLGLLNWQQLDGLPLIQRAFHRSQLARASSETQRQMLVHALIDLQVDDLLAESQRLLAECQELDHQAVCKRSVCDWVWTLVIEQEKKELERFLFDNVYRHPKLIEMRHRAATRLSQMFHLLVAYPTSPACPLSTVCVPTRRRIGRGLLSGRDDRPLLR